MINNKKWPLDPRAPKNEFEVAIAELGMLGVSPHMPRGLREMLRGHDGPIIIVGDGKTPIKQAESFPTKPFIIENFNLEMPKIEVDDIQLPKITPRHQKQRERFYKGRI